MKADEKYNQIIDKIEKHVRTKPYKKNSEILNCVMEETGYYAKQRDFNAIFGFINGQTPLKYISARQLMNAYKYMIGFEKYEEIDMNHVLEMTCTADQPRFIKLFKNRFGKPPMSFLNDEEVKREDFYEEPEYWGSFDDRNIKEEEIMEAEMNTLSRNTMFGIDKAIYERIVEIQNMTAAYGCSDSEAEAAYEFSKEINISLEEAFEYIAPFCIPAEEINEYYADDLKDGNLTDETDTVEKYYVNMLLNDMKNKTIMHCHFDLGMDPGAAFDIYIREDEEGVDLSNVDKIHAFALAYVPGCKTKEVFGMTDYYLSRNSDKEVDYDQFANYLDWVWEHGDWEEAYGISTATYENLIEKEKHTDWYQAEMVDKEYDMNSGIEVDEKRRADWEYYRNPHEYPEDEYDGMHEEKEDLWEIYSEMKSYNDDTEF